MAEYANKALKEVLVCIAGCVGFADTLTCGEREFRNSKKAKRSLQAMMNHAQKAMEIICDGLDLDQMAGIKRYADSCTLMVMPKYDPRTEKECYIVASDDMEVLLKDVISDCVFCEKEGKELKRCRVRKALMNSGIIPLGSGDCPYKG